MNIHPIRSEKDYKKSLKRVEELWDSTRKDDLDELDVLATLIDVYEKENYNILPPDPIEAIKFRMEQENISKSELAEYLGGKNRVSEILSRKRKLTVDMIKKLSQGLNIPAQSLIGQ